MKYSKTEESDNNYLMPSLPVFIFYGNHNDELESRYCIGFDLPEPEAKNIIDLINQQHRFINADNSPKNWRDKNKKSYAVTILTLEKDKDNLTNIDTQKYIQVIENVTGRRTQIKYI